MIEVDESDLQKVRDALNAAAEHHVARDESNARLHLAPEARLSPLTSTLLAERDRVDRLLEPPA